MSNWQMEYQGKLVSPDDAVQMVHSGDRVYIPAGEPRTLVIALAGRAGDVQNVEVIVQIPSELQIWFEPGVEASFNASIESAGGGMSRKAMAARFADYYPTLYSKTFKAFDERPSEAQSIDVFLCSVSPPDANGHCCFGVRPWHKPSFVRRARLTIAEVDPDLPRIVGGSFVHVEEIDYFVERQIPASPRARPETAPHVRPIAGYIKELIRDGDTVQIGGGSATEPLPRLGIFDGKHDLGWHSEVTPRSILEAMREGIITGARKTLNPGKLVTTMLSVTPEDQEDFENDPRIELRDVTYVNDIQVIAAHDNMVAINNALSVDLTGQIASEALGPRIWTGMGGQPEFAIGAFLSKGGRSITVLPSQTSSGITRICAQLEPGSYVTVPRYFADTIVTEWGVARLLGKSQRQRALELINIAHPDHRADLKQAAERLFWP